MNKRTFKSSVYGEIADVIKAIANAHRLEILDLLANGSKSVEQIAEETAMTVANASQHLQVLKRKKLVETERQGNYVYYQLSSVKVYQAWRSMCNLTLDLSNEVKEVVSDYRDGWNSKESLRLSELDQYLYP